MWWAQLAPLLFAIGSVLLVRFAPFGPPNDSYYGIAAQIMPVLLVALAIEGRSGAFWGAPGARLYGAAVLLALAVGELSALLGATGVLTRTSYDAYGDVIGQSEGPTLLLLMLTTAGLVGGFVGVIVVALVDPAGLRTRDGAGSKAAPSPAAPTGVVSGAPSQRAVWLVLGAALTALLLGVRRSR